MSCTEWKWGFRFPGDPYSAVTNEYYPSKAAAREAVRRDHNLGKKLPRSMEFWPEGHGRPCEGRRRSR
jgi:hypothetical protein